MDDRTRCEWPGNPLAVRYHDEEWGVPLHDESRLFEALVLGGAQAGLSWDTILKKRENYRAAFDGFDAERVATYGESDMARLLADPGIVRNRVKIAAAIDNARATLAIRDKFGGLDPYLWAFVGGTPIVNRWQSLGELPVLTAEAEAMSKDLRRHGFRFVGPTICYAVMQAAGLVNDHVVGCFRWEEVQAQA
jgi:DNA-3-methyladenine glycosylase I